MKISVALLAAGKASRYGGNKLLAVHPRNHKFLLEHVIDQYTVAGFTDITVLTGYWHQAIEKAMSPRASLHYVRDWEEGIAASLRVAAALDNSSDGLMIGLGDQVGITTSLINQLVEAFKQRPIITATECQGIISPPVIFPIDELTVLSALKGDSGAGKYLRKLTISAPDTIQTVPISALTDIDCPEDWQNLD